MSVIVTRAGKGSALSYTEMDANFTNLNADKVETSALVGLETTTHAEATYATITTVNGKEPTITSGTTSQYWRGDKTWQTLDKASVGLGNVDNTTDVNKPVSTAQQTALDLKAPLASPSFTGTVTVDSLEVGTKIIPQNSQSTAYTLVLADSGKHILHPSADTTARVFTIPANGSVAYPIGTALTFINQASAGVVTIAITTDIMRLAGTGTTGSRTLAANGVATAIKLTATEWIISGVGLT